MLLGVSPCINLLKNPPPLGVGSVKEIKILASGSNGNCYTVDDGQTCIMLDCGLPFNRIKKMTDFKIPDAVLVTHEHCDHAKAAKDFINRGVDVYLTKGTSEALQLPEHNRLHIPEHLPYLRNGQESREEHAYCHRIRAT